MCRFVHPQCVYHTRGIVHHDVQLCNFARGAAWFVRERAEIEKKSLEVLGSVLSSHHPLESAACGYPGCFCSNLAMPCGQIVVAWQR